MFRGFGQIGTKYGRGCPAGTGGRSGSGTPPKSSVTGPSLLVNCYLEIKFHKKIPLVPPPIRKLNRSTSNGGIIFMYLRSYVRLFLLYRAICLSIFTAIIGLQPTKTRAELDSSTVLKQIFYEYHPLILQL